jgi:hypothetical protein
VLQKYFFLESTHNLLLPITPPKHSIQIKNSYYSCIYLTCVLYYSNTFNLNIFSVSYFLKNGVHVLFGGTEYSRKYGTVLLLRLLCFLNISILTCLKCAISQCMSSEISQVYYSFLY